MKLVSQLITHALSIVNVKPESCTHGKKYSTHCVRCEEHKARTPFQR